MAQPTVCMAVGGDTYIIKGGFLYINRRSQLYTPIIQINNILYEKSIRAFTFRKQRGDVER